MLLQHVYMCCRRFHTGPLLLSKHLFQYGEYVLVKLAHRSKLFKLQDGGVLNTARGQLPHSHVVGQEPGDKFADSAGLSMCVRRPSLAEYVCLMKRGPAPSYPKDIWTMIGHMDIGLGANVLEAGSGSGSLSLHLSRAVGDRGLVYSFESATLHMNRAKANYQNWCDSWDIANGTTNPWPRNVHFFEASVDDAINHVHTPLDAVALDMLEPWTVVGALLPILNPNAIIAVYLTNITQVLSLSACVESTVVHVEEVIEVTHKKWTVKPVARKSLRLKTPPANDIKYICRPSHSQLPHTGFLTVLRYDPSIGTH